VKKRISTFITIIFICSILLTSSASIVFAEDTNPSDVTSKQIEKEIHYDFIPDHLLGDIQKHMTREEFCEVAVHLYETEKSPGSPSDSTVISAHNPFTDTINPAVLKAYKLGIVCGVGNGKFNPQEKLTIQEKAVMLYRTLKILDPNIDTRVKHDLSFSDGDKISPWAVEAVTYLNANNIIIGNQNNQLQPLENITRADSHKITNDLVNHYLTLALPLGGTITDYLCYGYHVLKEGQGYIDSQYINTRAPILDQAKLEETNYERTSDVGRTVIKDYVSSNATDFYKDFNADANVKYKGVLYSGGVKAEYGNYEDMHKESVLIKHMELHPISEKYLQCTNEQLKELLADQFLKDLETKDPEYIFDTYGTHLITRCSLGGRIELSLKFNNTAKLTKEQIAVGVNASYGGGSADADAETKKQAKELISNSELQFTALGGDGITGNKIEKLTEQYATWVKSLDNKPDICQVSNFQNSMVPIWELTDGETADALKTEFNKYVVTYETLLGKYLYKEDPVVVVKPFITDIIVVADKDKDKALAKIPSNYKVVRINPGTGKDSEELDANHGAGGDFIYIAYLLGTDKSKAIAYVRLSLDGPNGYNYKMLPVDLNKGAGGATIYLNFHYATSANEPPIREISGYYGEQYSLPSGWKSLPTNIDLNKGAKGSFIYLTVKR